MDLERKEAPADSTSLWQGLDRLSFCENAILLEVCQMSQGDVIVTRKEKTMKSGPGQYDDRFTENFLDDIAFLAAGPGGKDNVAAACLERGSVSPSPSLVVRVARNEGFGPVPCASLQEIVDLSEFCYISLLSASGDEVLEVEPTSNSHMSGSGHDGAAGSATALHKAVEMCQGRLLKHISRFLGEVRHAQCSPIEHYQIPRYSMDTRIVGLKRDKAIHGEYCSDNHPAYANIVQNRVGLLRRLCSEAVSTVDDTTLMMCEITQTAHLLRGYTDLLRSCLRQNLGIRAKPQGISSMIEAIIKRVGKLARTFRAVLTIAKFMTVLSQTDTSVHVMGLDSHHLQVPELANRTYADLKGRGGRMLVGKSEAKLTQLLGRSNRYRMHAEIQLLVFYERWPNISLATNYIGGDKLCCYLCHQFITTHKRFDVNGSHQSLYSLWMVPDQIPGLSRDAQVLLRSVLSYMCAVLDNKVSRLSKSTKSSKVYHPQRESCDNLSRLTVHLSKSHLLRKSAPPQTTDPTPILPETVVEEAPEIPEDPGHSTISQIESERRDCSDSTVEHDEVEAASGLPEPDATSHPRSDASDVLSTTTSQPSSVRAECAGREETSSTSRHRHANEQGGSSSRGVRDYGTSSRRERKGRHRHRRRHRRNHGLYSHGSRRRKHVSVRRRTARSMLRRPLEMVLAKLRQMLCFA